MLLKVRELFLDRHSPLSKSTFTSITTTITMFFLCLFFLDAVYTWEVAAALHAVRLLAVAEAADVDAQGLEVLDALGDHQVLLDQVAAVRARLHGGGEEAQMTAELQMPGNLPANVCDCF